MNTETESAITEDCFEIRPQLPRPEDITDPRLLPIVQDIKNIFKKEFVVENLTTENANDYEYDEFGPIYKKMQLLDPSTVEEYEEIPIVKESDDGKRKIVYVKVYKIDHGSVWEYLVDQNTGLWKKVRCGKKKLRVGGSDAAISCNMSKYEYALDRLGYILVMSQALFDVSFKGNEATSHGHTSEPIIAKIYNVYTGNYTAPGRFWANKVYSNYYGASPDRMILKVDPKTNEPFHPFQYCGVLEIKAPYYGPYKEFKLEHLVQVQYQMWMTGMKWCHYFACALDHDKPEETKEPALMAYYVEYSKEFMDGYVKPRLFWFSKSLESGMPLEPIPERFDSPKGEKELERYRSKVRMYELPKRGGCFRDCEIEIRSRTTQYVGR
jgi:hypothetical protein